MVPLLPAPVAVKSATNAERLAISQETVPKAVLPTVAATVVAVVAAGVPARVATEVVVARQLATHAADMATCREIALKDKSATTVSSRSILLSVIHTDH